MATTTFYLRDFDSGATEFLAWDRSPEAASATTNPNATSLTGWTVAKLTPIRYVLLNNGTEVSLGSLFSTTLIYPQATDVPAPTLRFSGTEFATYGAAISIGFGKPYNGYFPAGTWTFNIPVIAVGSGGAQDGRFGLRVHKGSSTGTDVTELTSARLTSTTATNLGTASPVTLIATWSAPAFYLNDEYLYTTLGWEITGSTNNNNSDVLIRRGVGATLVTPSFRRRIYNMT